MARDSLRKMLGVKSASNPKLSMGTNKGMQPRLNEQTITKGVQETNRRDVQGGADMGRVAYPKSPIQGGKYSTAGRVQNGLTGAGNNSPRKLRLKK